MPPQPPNPPGQQPGLPGQPNYLFWTRHKGDGLVRDEVNWTHAGALTIYGENPGESVTRSFYPYGTMDSFEHPARQHEFHGKRKGGCSAIATLVFEDDRNELQLRRVGDTGCLRITNYGGLDFVIGTEQPNENISIIPNGTLTLKDGVRIGNESLEELIKRLIKESQST